MKIAVMSDLHLDFDARAYQNVRQGPRPIGQFDIYFNPPKPNADLLVLAGDIHNGTQRIDWALRSFAIPLVLIAGNHKFFGHELFQVVAASRQKA